MAKRYQSSPHYRSNITFIDLLFNQLTGFIALFILAILIGLGDTEDEGVITPKAEFLIIMTWPDGNRNDIDLWVKHEIKGQVSFMGRDSGFMHLERDDLGETNESEFGEGVPSPYNRETVAIRRIVEGNYRINVHFYSKKGPYSLTEGIPVHIVMYKVNPFSQVHEVTRNLMTEGHELTAFNFYISDRGTVFDVDETHMNWILNNKGGGRPSGRHPTEHGRPAQSGT